MTGNRNIVVMPIETTARELLPKLYLAARFAEQGFISYLGAKSLVNEVALRSRSAIFLDKGYHSSVSEPQYAKLRDAGCLVVGLDEENGVDFKDFHMLNVRMPDQLFAIVDHFFVWGTAQYDHLKANRPSFDAAKVTVTGHPRFDLLKPPFLAMYREKAEALRRRYGPFVLLNTNTKYGNNINGRDFIIENYGSRVKGLMERLAYDDRRLESNIELARRLADETSFNVLIRPHPEEDIAVYHRTFAGNDKVTAIFDDTPIYWLLAADIVIHNHSTTGLEAAMLGKTPIAFSPQDVDPGFVPWLPVACSLQIKSVEEILELARKDVQSWPTAPDISDSLRDFFSFGSDAAGAVVAAVMTLARSHPSPMRAPAIEGYLLRLKARSYLQRLKGGATMSVLARNKLRDLRPEVVAERIAAIQAQAPSMMGLQIDTIHPHLYRIRSA